MYVNLRDYAKYLIRVHCFPTSGFMGWACPSYLAPCVFDPPLCLSPLPAEAALYGAPALWHSARHQDCSAPGGGGCSAAPALHWEAAQWTPPPTDRTRPAPPLLQPAAQWRKIYPSTVLEYSAHESPKAEARHFGLNESLSLINHMSFQYASCLNIHCN